MDSVKAVTRCRRVCGFRYAGDMPRSVSGRPVTVLLTGDAVDHRVGRPEAGRDQIGAPLAQHDPGDRRLLAGDPADGAEREAAAGCGVRAGLDADEPLVPEQAVG